jgi:hypothetical protein
MINLSYKSLYVPPQLDGAHVVLAAQLNKSRRLASLNHENSAAPALPAPQPGLASSRPTRSEVGKLATSEN